MQAVNDAVEEVSSLLNKFQGTWERPHAERTFSAVLSVVMCDSRLSGPPACAPDLSDPVSAAAYAAEELTEAKEGFVRYFSDEEGVKTHL